jgi:hypothetical protein
MRTASSRAPHGHLNRRLEQTLILRGSCDFEEAAEYAELLTVRVRRTSTIEVRPGDAQAPPRRGGEPLAHGAQREFVASLARAAVAFGVVGGPNKVLLDRLEPLLEPLMALRTAMEGGLAHSGL